MADGRFNQMPGYAGGYPPGVPNPVMPGMPGVAPFMQPQPGMPPVMQQQMMMAPGMRFPMQGMIMGPPATPPPPYHAHMQTPGIGALPNRPRMSLSKSKGQQSEKERLFEEQREKMKRFSKGASVVDADKLIGSFGMESKPKPKVTNEVPKLVEDDDDDGFGDFLSVSTGVSETKDTREGANTPGASEVTNSGRERTNTESSTSSAVEEKDENIQATKEEKKDLTTMMFECSDLSAPQKAKGFHKPSLNEVHRSHKSQALSFHESDHSRSWKQHTEDLDGLFKLPARTEVPVAPPNPAVYHVQAEPIPGAMRPGPLPTGPPPAYTDVTRSPVVPVSPTASHHIPVKMPDWCSFSVDEVPPVYRQVWEASLEKTKISTERLYPILMLSGVPREKLAHIWSMCNTFTPGQLIQPELWQILACVALVQNNYPVTSLDILSRCQVPPIPAFSNGAAMPVPSNTGDPTQLSQQVENSAPHAIAPHNMVGATQPHMVGTSQVSMSGTSHTAMPGIVQPHLTGPGQPHLVGASQPSVIGANQPSVLGACQPSVLGANQSPVVGSVSHSIIKPSPVVSSGVTHFGGEADDDFADFQAAVPTPSTTALDVQAKKSDIPQQVFENLSVPSLTQLGSSEDKYNNNVRSFFCSSDSSTGHTSPSLEDEDFTDGRDSLSQVSTSEQSENEDIRNFENYVEEFNKKNEGPDGSPLHCPFPNMKPGLSGLPAITKPLGPQIHTTGNSATMAGHHSVTTGIAGGQANPQSGIMSTIASSLPHPPKLSTPAVQSGGDFDEFKSAIPTTQPAGSGDEFEDFKSAPVLPGNANQQPGDLALIADEDKYDALRGFSLEQPSLFEKGSESSLTSISNIAAADTGEDDDWAEFADAGHTEVSSAEVPSQNTTVSNGKPSKQDILSLFSTAVTATPKISTVLEDNKSQQELDEFSAFGSSSTVPVTSLTSSWSGSLTNDLTMSMDNTAGGSKEEEEEDWSDFSTITNNDSTVQKNTTENSEGWSNFTTPAPQPTQQTWGDFSSPALASDSGEENGANMVTIKKQNLGTSEILGVFKVRSDPDTMSSYQLPSQPVAKSSPRSGGLGPRIPSEEGPPPMDFGHDEEEETYSRGYDLEDYMRPAPSTTTYSIFGTQSPAKYSTAKIGNTLKGKSGQEDSGSVHSLELPSAKSALDTYSVSSAELTSSDTTTGGDGPSESKSMDSLDFSSEPQDNRDVSPVTTSPVKHPIQPQELLDSMPDFADKYNIEHEAQGSDRYGHEWERCLTSCFQTISEANTIFNSISSSTVCNEVLKSSKGSDYVSGVIEVYRVVCRVITSMRSTAISSTELEKTLKDIDLAWNNLTAFLVGASLLPESSTLVFSNSILKSDTIQAKALACGLCLLNVDAKPLANSTMTNSMSNASSSKLTYAGRQYHATCANFWVNRVDQTLPSLTLPELF